MDIEPKIKISAGLDVHSKIVVVTLLKETSCGKVEPTTKEFSTFPKELSKLASWLHCEGVELAVMESTGVYWKSVFEALETEGVKTYVVNARRVKQIPGKKTDVNDSHWLATLGRYGLVKNSFIPEKALRDLRLITHYRMKLKNTIASEVNRMHKILNDGGIRLSLVFTDLQCASAQAVIKGILEDKPISDLISMLKGQLKKKTDDFRGIFSKPLGNDHKFLLQTIVNHIDYLNQECQKLDARIFEAMKPYDKQWKILQTIPGIDALAASIIIAETGIDMHQFESTERFCSWAGMCPGNNESAGKRKSSRITKGSSTLRRTLCEIANAAVRTRSQFQGYYNSLKIRLGHKRTIIAAGHKILRVIFKLLLDNCGYTDPRIDYEELIVKRNAPRWIKCLSKYGYLTPA